MGIYFVAKFDLELVCENETVSLKNGEIVFCDNIEGEIKVIPKQKQLEEYLFNLKECLNYDRPYFSVKRLSGNNYLIELKPRFNYSPTYIIKKIINFENESYLVEMHNSCIAQIYSPTQNYSLNKSGPSGFEYEIKTIGGKKILSIIFNFEGGRYYYVFDKDKLLFEGPVKEINIKDDHLTILKDDISCYGQKLVLDFNIKDGGVEKYFVYADDREAYLEINILLLFMDAIKIKNYALCKPYLSQDLLSINQEDLFEFLDCDNYYFIENSCVLEKNNEVNKIVHFEVSNNTIVNILD